MSAKRFGLGLVVGKFAPLHRGHEGLIAAAAADCERLAIVSWSQPELPRCDVERRRRWLAQRCPQHTAWVLDDAELRRLCRQAGVAARGLPANTAPDDEQQRFLAWLLLEVLRLQPDALFNNEAYGPPCAQRLSEALGRPVVSVSPDRDRRAHPVSGTQLRQAGPAHAAQLAPEVAEDWVPRIAILGGESSGKSTLAAELALALSGVWVPEFGRAWWEARGGQLTEADLLHIARTQVAHEVQACAALPRIVIGDTSPLTTLGYSLWTCGRADPALVALARRPYDALVLCQGDFPFQQDGTRRDAAFRAEQQAWYRSALARLPTPSLEVGGSLRRRVARVKRWLTALDLLPPA